MKKINIIGNGSHANLIKNILKYNNLKFKFGRFYNNENSIKILKKVSLLVLEKIL